MKIKNSTDQYGLVSIILHWFFVILIFSMAGIGFYMVSLDYYDPLYRSLPNLHKSIGILLIGLLIFRLMWRWYNIKPTPVNGSKTWEIKLAHLVHYLLYLLIFLIGVSGYLISTADGRSIAVFNLFNIPAVTLNIENQEDKAGLIHLWLVFILLATIAIHLIGALKHHFINKDITLTRMLTTRRKS